jgi:hypothetical protein
VNVDTGQFEAITDRLAAVEDSMAVLDARLHDVARLHEIVTGQQARRQRIDAILDSAGTPAPPPRRPRHLRAVE